MKIGRRLFVGLLLFSSLSARAGDIRVRLFKHVSAVTIPWKGLARPAQVHKLARADGTIDIVAVFPMEEYLKGVVPQEMPVSWPLEALKAQAVAARSYAYRRLSEHKNRSYDVESNVFDQQFQFDGLVSLAKINRVLAETKNLILVDSKGEFFEALYHSDCGGMIESAAEVWGGASSELAHPDCAHPSFHWKAELDKADLVHRLADYFGLPTAAELISFQAIGHSSTGRVKTLRADWGKWGKRDLSAQEFRRLVGFNKVLSTNFRMSWMGPHLNLTGVGRGHGVGLCQFGARAMAQSGKSFRDILKFYYPKAHLMKVKDTNTHLIAASGTHL